MHEAFDPTRELPPAEPAGVTLARFEAAADLAMDRCAECGAPAIVIDRDRDGLPRAIEFEHHPRCSESAWTRL